MLRSPLSSPLRHPLSSPLAARRGGGAFNPATLFASGEQGGWYDPSDLTTLFQDTAGTVPVTAPGQAVARINDKSGRDNHLTQSASLNMPVLRQDSNNFYYLEFDGSNDWIGASGAIGVSSPDFGVFYAVEFSATPTAYSVWASNKYKSGGTGLSSRFTVFTVRDYDTASQHAINTKYVSGFLYNTSFSVTPWVNNVARTTITHTSGNAAGETGFRLGSTLSGAEFLNGRLYGFVIRRASFTPSEISSINAYLGSKVGLFF